MYEAVLFSVRIYLEPLPDTFRREYILKVHVIDDVARRCF